MLVYLYCTSHVTHVEWSQGKSLRMVKTWTAETTPVMSRVIGLCSWWAFSPWSIWAKLKFSCSSNVDVLSRRHENSLPEAAAAGRKEPSIWKILHPCSIMFISKLQPSHAGELAFQHGCNPVLPFGEAQGSQTFGYSFASGRQWVLLQDMRPWWTDPVQTDNPNCRLPLRMFQSPSCQDIAHCLVRPLLCCGNLRSNWPANLSSIISMQTHHSNKRSQCHAHSCCLYLPMGRTANSQIAAASFLSWRRLNTLKPKRAKRSAAKMLWSWFGPLQHSLQLLPLGRGEFVGPLLWCCEGLDFQPEPTQGKETTQNVAQTQVHIRLLKMRNN